VNLGIIGSAQALNTKSTNSAITTERSLTLSNFYHPIAQPSFRLSLAPWQTRFFASQRMA
jgi:hypothetical protein